MDYFRKVCPNAMNSNVRKPSIAVTSISRSIDGKESVGDILRKAKKDLIFRRIVLAMLLVILVVWIIYLFVGGFISDLFDASLSLIE